MSRHQRKSNTGAKETEHRQIQSLDDIVGDAYTKTRWNTQYRYGEIDYIGVMADGHLDLYEVKSTEHGYGKACRQLDRMYTYFRDRVHRMYIYIAGDGELIEYRHK
jgi:hypothetical protein